eukprot:gene12915-biopygen13355
MGFKLNPKPWVHLAGFHCKKQSRLCRAARANKAAADTATLTRGRYCDTSQRPIQQYWSAADTAILRCYHIADTAILHSGGARRRRRARVRTVAKTLVFLVLLSELCSMHENAELSTVDCRFHDRVAYPKRGADEPLLLWRIVGERVHKGGDLSASGEWMYQLAAFEANPWDAYNEAALLWAHGCAPAARRRAAAAVAAAARDVREALEALHARITDSPMPTLLLAEVVAAPGSVPDADLAARPITSAGILDEAYQWWNSHSVRQSQDLVAILPLVPEVVLDKVYHIAEQKLAQTRGEEWARQRQHVADKVQEKRKGKAGGDAPCNAAAPSTANASHVTLTEEWQLK